MLFLKQSTASQALKLGPFVDDTDGKTAETGLTVSASDIRLSKNGGSYAAKNSGGGTHDENGWYGITLDATDTNTVGTLQISCHKSGALPVFMEVHVLEEVVYERLFASGAAGYSTHSAPSVPTAGQVADAVWDEPRSGHTTSGTYGEHTGDAAMRGTDSANTTAPPTVGAVADAVWDEPRSGHTTSGTYGEHTGDAAMRGTDSANTTTPPTANAIRTELETDGGKLDHLWETTEDDGGTRRFTTNALEQAPSGGGGGGGDATEAKQDQILSKLNSSPINIVNNVTSGGVITTYLGDDDVDEHTIDVPVSDTGEVLKARLDAASSVIFGAGEKGKANEIIGTCGTASHASDITTIPVTITSANKKGTASDEYTYHIKTVDSSDNEHVEVEGCLKLKYERATPTA